VAERESVRGGDVIASISFDDNPIYHGWAPWGGGQPVRPSIASTPRSPLSILDRLPSRALKEVQAGEEGPKGSGKTSGAMTPPVGVGRISRPCGRWFGVGLQ
jgi:hypothetical protein